MPAPFLTLSSVLVVAFVTVFVVALLLFEEVLDELEAFNVTYEALT